MEISSLQYFGMIYIYAGFQTWSFQFLCFYLLCNTFLENIIAVYIVG